MKRHFLREGWNPMESKLQPSSRTNIRTNPPLLPFGDLPVSLEKRPPTGDCDGDECRTDQRLGRVEDTATARAKQMFRRHVFI